MERMINRKNTENVVFKNRNMKRWKGFDISRQRVQQWCVKQGGEQGGESGECRGVGRGLGCGSSGWGEKVRHCSRVQTIVEKGSMLKTQTIRI